SRAARARTVHGGRRAAGVAAARSLAGRRAHSAPGRRHHGSVPPPREKESPMKLGAYTACLHDKTLEEALDILCDLGLTSVEVNSGGFIPSPHLPVDALLASE